MRWLAAVVVLGVLAAIGWGVAGSHATRPSLDLSIAPGIPSPDPGDTNILGLRMWSVAPGVEVRAHRHCGDVRLSTDARAFFDRKSFARGSNAGGTTADLGSMRAGSTRTVFASATGDAGDTVRLRVTATCDGRAVHRERSLSLPAESCFGGPIHTYLVRGAVTRNDDNYEGRRVPLRPGDLVGNEAIVDVPHNGHVLLGATECNNFHVELGPGRYTSGGYDAGGRGDAFTGRGALVIGDEHVGGFAIVGKAWVQPIGRGCAHCSPPPVSFEVRTQSARRATIRVFRGAVRVVAGEGLSDVKRALAGQQIDVLCASRCRLTRPRLWQPDERWTTPPGYRAHVLAPVLRGRRPAANRLAPARAHVVVHDLLAAGGAPEQLAVLWERSVRTGAGRAAGSLQTQQGLIVWQRTGSAVWRRVLSRVYPISDSPPSLSTGDVTGDGHPDLLVTLEQGSGACGPREIFATVRSRIRRIFYRDECESFVALKGGAVQLVEPVGRCPLKQGSAHCFGGSAHIVERWNGRRLVVASRTVRCNWPRLDPAADCNRRKQRR